ncbi:BlaI/MecI/CopY family transcriptional regulator [Candidatus Cyanaurora vandensis]|uniref:BlaI/MecI/CopY family transcriptional regulator n=1 Tax=Candidatus Cyanaurora vandensis TaxID=2714958 RepID=UPI00257BFE6F|nr:BlaI/MecI/CopY family transcriptional regulator [Candidatus Cyanaurora vandensis]
MPLPDHRPLRLTLGPLEREILEILWHFQEATAREVHEFLLRDPDRELSHSSVTTVLSRLLQKGWVGCDETGRVFRWRVLVSQSEAAVLEANSRLREFLAVGTPELMATLTDDLDTASREQLEAIARSIETARRARQKEDPCT